MLYENEILNYLTGVGFEEVHLFGDIGLYNENTISLVKNHNKYPDCFIFNKPIEKTVFFHYDLETLKADCIIGVDLLFTDIKLKTVNELLEFIHRLGEVHKFFENNPEQPLKMS